jgi:uncharacterized damage-inducible protein DinB
LLCCSLEQSLAEIRQWCAPLSDLQIWTPVGEAGSVGFQLRHLAGSVDRLLTYARQQALSEAQREFLGAEAAPGASKQVLLAELAATYAAAAAFAETASDLDSVCFIGRQRLEAPLGVLLAHIAEHTQRHTGQLIVLAKLAR